MKTGKGAKLALTLFGIMALGLLHTSYAEPKPNAEPGISETLKGINQSFKRFEVQVINWPDELQAQLGQFKESAFLAFPKNKPSGKLPLLITLHGAGGKTMSLQKQLARSAQVKGLALAEVAGRDLILLEPNSSGSWDPDTLDVMLDYVLETYEEIDESRIYVMGHSMGGKIVSRGHRIKGSGYDPISVSRGHRIKGSGYDPISVSRGQSIKIKVK